MGFVVVERVAPGNTTVEYTLNTDAIIGFRVSPVNAGWVQVDLVAPVAVSEERHIQIMGDPASLQGLLAAAAASR